MCSKGKGGRLNRAASPQRLHGNKCVHACRVVSLVDTHTPFSRHYYIHYILNTAVGCFPKRTERLRFCCVVINELRFSHLTSRHYFTSFQYRLNLQRKSLIQHSVAHVTPDSRLCSLCNDKAGHSDIEKC